MERIVFSLISVARFLLHMNFTSLENNEITIICKEFPFS